MLTADVLVVGAGLAGLHTAAQLAGRGHDVLLVDRRRDLTTSIRTTGIFVRRTLDDFPLPPAHLGPPIRRVVLHPPDGGRPVELVSDRDEFRVGEMGPLYGCAADAAVRAGVRLSLGTRYEGRDGDRSRLHTAEGPVAVRSRILVGADGARSAVARDLALDRNRRMLVGAEEVRALDGSDGPPTFHCVIDPRLAPGYLAWVVDDGRHAHVGVAGTIERFPDGLAAALDRFRAIAPGAAGRTHHGQAERRGGPIPVGGLLRRISCPDGLLVGDAAGAVSPLTAGGLDPCLRLSDHAVDVIDRALRTGSPGALAHYDGAALRRHFRGRLLLRRGLDQVRTPRVAAAGVALLRTPPGRAAARRILFGDRSFPTVGGPARRGV